MDEAKKPDQPERNEKPEEGPGTPDRPQEQAAAETSRPSRHVHPLVWILAVGLVVRVLLLGWFRGEPLYVWDEREYNALAVGIAERGAFQLDGRPTAIRPPLYPAVVAGVYKLAGAENYQAVRAFQLLLGLATVVGVFLLSKDLYGRRVGLWAAGLYCFYPSMLGQANLLLTETLFTFWLVLACLAVVRYFRKPKLGTMLLAGVLLGLGALTRSVLWLSPPLLAVYVLIAARASFPRRLAAAGVMLAAFAAVLAPWSIRSTKLEKTFVAVDVMGGRNFMMGNYEHTPMARAWDAISMKGEKSWHDVLAQKHPESAGTTNGRRDKLALRYGLSFVAEHPGLTVKRDVVKFFNFWQLERSLVAGMAQGAWGEPPLWAVLVATGLIFTSYAVAMIAGIFGAVVVPPRNWRAHLFLLFVIAFVCGIHTLVFAHSRYHLPLMPIVLVFSAAAVVRCGKVLRQWKTWRFWLAAGLCLVLVAAWTWDIVMVDFQRFMEVFR